VSLRTLHRRVGEVARWRRPQLDAKGDPDAEQSVAAGPPGHHLPAAGLGVLAEDETHISLLPWVRSTWIVRGSRQQL